MMSTLWRMLGRHSLCGVALLAGASLVQAQAQLPTIPTLPGMAPGAPTNPIQQVQAQEPAVKSQSSLGVPTTSVVAPAVPPAAPASNEDKARIERLEQQIQELTNTLKGLQTRPLSTSNESANIAAPTSNLSVSDVQKLVNSYLSEKEEAQKVEAASRAKASALEGYKVGTDLKMSASWQNGVMFETPNKDFYMRAGFRFQWDNVWFNQNKTSIAAVGKDIDGDYWRRIRPNFNGGFWEVGEFNVEIKLENIQNGISGMDDVWVGVKDVPLIGTVRLGHFHLPHGLEADMYSSSKPMTFFEVSSMNNAFYGGERCGSGIWLTNAFLDQRVTYAAALYRPENADNGVQFQNGDYAGIFRMTGLPYYSDDGRCFLHLGGAATFRHAQNGVVAFATDPELRDRSGGDNGYGGPITVTTAGVAGTVAGVKPAPGNATNWVTTGNVAANGSTILATELWYNNGPFSIQAEYGWAYIDNAKLNGKNGNIGFTGGYIQAGYFITGESRQYDKRLGRLNSEYIARANTPFWFVRGEDGKLNWGLGAWEVATRFSRIDLDNSVIRGGIMDQWEAGVNWHLNNNLRIQFMYLHADRYDLPGASGILMNGFGVRTQLTF